MYVLVDMEWISNQRGNHWPTQLAATRVDAQWNTVDIFSALFRPKGFSFQQWGHMAFSGWNREQFLNGESLYAGLDAFRLWLQPEDTICWWHQEASDLFNMFSKVSGVPDMTQHVVLLCDYIYGYLAGQEASVGSPYKICAARNIVTPSPAHCSVNDVATMQLLAQVIGFEQKYLLEPPKRWSKDAIAQKGSSAYKLLYDPQAKLLHQSDCELLPDDRHFPAFLTFKLPIRRKYKPCSCCIRDIKPMTDSEYCVRGCTALLDAIGGAIHHIGNVHKYAREEDVPAHTLFVITTDGMENASRLYDSARVKQMIEHEKSKYGWEFLFLGANIDAVETAKHFGISEDRAVNYHSDSVGTRLNYEVVSCAITSMRSGAPMSADWKAPIEADYKTREGEKD